MLVKFRQLVDVSHLVKEALHQTHVKEGGVFFYHVYNRFFRPGHGSPSASNVAVVLLLVVVSTKAFSFHNRSHIAKLRIQLA